MVQSGQLARNDRQASPLRYTGNALFPGVRYLFTGTRNRHEVAFSGGFTHLASSITSGNLHREKGYHFIVRARHERRLAHDHYWSAWAGLAFEGRSAFVSHAYTASLSEVTGLSYGGLGPALTIRLAPHRRVEGSVGAALPIAAVVTGPGSAVKGLFQTRLQGPDTFTQLTVRANFQYRLHKRWSMSTGYELDMFRSRYPDLFEGAASLVHASILFGL